MPGRRIVDFFVYLIVRLFVCVMQALPLETCARISRGMAWLAGDVLRLRHNVVDENLRHAFPQLNDVERRDMTRRMWEHLFLMVVEIAHAQRKIHDTNWRDYIRFKDGSLMSGLYFDGRPAVVVSGHFGNFEMGAYQFGIFGFQTYSIARDLDNPYLHRWINEFRGSKGQFILPKQGSAEMANQLLQKGETLSLLADQYAGPKGCWVDFFGRPASTHKAIALFSLGHNAPLAVSYAKRVGNRPLQYEMGVEEVADPADPNGPAQGVRELTQWYSDVLERIIRRSPEQYWWVHRRWKDQQLAPQRRAKKAA